VGQYQKGKTNLDFIEARDSEWQWHQLGRMQICTSLQADNHASTPPLSFLQARCPPCCPTNSIEALKENRHCIHIRKVLLNHHYHHFNGCFPDKPPKFANSPQSPPTLVLKENT